MARLNRRQKLNPLINCLCICTSVLSWSMSLAFQAAFKDTISTVARDLETDYWREAYVYQEAKNRYAVTVVKKNNRERTVVGHLP